MTKIPTKQTKLKVLTLVYVTVRNYVLFFLIIDKLQLL